MNRHKIGFVIYWLSTPVHILTVGVGGGVSCVIAHSNLKRIVWNV